jgi:hypothetical protein
MRAGACQRERCRGANAARGAGHQRDAVSKEARDIVHRLFRSAGRM